MAAAASSTKKRVHLSLETRVKVINEAESSYSGSRALAEKFGCGRTQILEILKNKESILSAYQSNPLSSHKKRRLSKFSGVNEALYQWYCMYMTHSKNGIPPSGPQLCAKGKEIATRLGIQKFEGSNGWLARWKTNIKEFAEKETDGTAKSWKEKLPEILKGYSKENVYNLSETGFIWRALPVGGFKEKAKECGKKSSKRFTLAFLVSAAGEKEKPVVVWKSANPRCFRGFDRSRLPVCYYDQCNAWMSGEILDNYLTLFNSKLVAEKRSVLLLMGSTCCHPEHLKSKYSNIRVEFMPASTTPKLQPLDFGIISSFKTYYRRFLLQYVLAKIDGAVKAANVTAAIDVLTAIRWVALAWREVKAGTIVECFKRAGILNDTFNLQDCVCTANSKPFEDSDETSSLAPLIISTIGAQGSCSVSEYISGDSSLPVCTTLDDKEWEEDFMASLSQDGQSENDLDSDFDLAPPEPAIKNFKEAVEALENVQVFLESRNCLEVATKASTLLTEVVAVQVSQSTLTQYFPSEQ